MDGRGEPYETLQSVEAAPDHVQVALISVDPDGGITHWNRAAERLYGWSESEAVGHNVTEFLEDRADSLEPGEIIDRARSGQLWEGEVAVRVKSGSSIPANVTSHPVIDATGNLAAIVGVSVDVSDRERVERRLAAQYSVTRVLAEAESLEEATPGLLRAIGESLRWDVAVLWRRSGDGGHLEFVDSWHSPGVALPEFEAASRALTFERGVGLPGRVLADGIPTWISDIASDDGFLRAPVALGEGLRSAAAFPILLGDRVLGIIESFSARPTHSDQQMLELMSAIGNQIGQFVERKRAEQEREQLLAGERAAREEAEAATRRLWQLQHITEAALAYLSLDELLDELLKRVANVLDVSTALILLMSEDREFLTVRATVGLSFTTRSRIPFGRTVAGRVAAEGKPILLEDATDSELALPELRKSGVRSLAAVPLIVESRVIGVLMVATSQPRDFSGEDELLMRLAADRMALAIEHARLFDREYGIAAALQHSLLLKNLPNIPNVDLAARYLPGGQGVKVGGDWYDVIALPQGKVALVIGDVAGHGIRAATIMAQLRYAVRAYALDHGSPVEVLQRTNRLVNSFERTGMVTVAYCLFDPDSGEVCYAVAGHPPPVLRLPDGTTTVLEEGRSIPLGVLEDVRFFEGAAVLAPGSTLLMYTDGLVEHTAAHVYDGIEMLRRAVQEAPAELEAMCEHILRVFFKDDGPPDDVAFIALAPLLMREPLKMRVPGKPAHVGELRRALRKWLRDAGAGDDDIFDITVASGEAISNAIEHAYGLGEGEIDVSAEAVNGEVTITVRDHGQWRAVRETDRGRGFVLMRSLMDEVRVTPAAEGTEVKLIRRLDGADETVSAS